VAKIRTQCKHCEAKFGADSSAIGQRKMCPSCKRPFVVEAIADETTPAPAAPPTPRGGSAPRVPSPSTRRAELKRGEIIKYASIAGIIIGSVLAVALAIWFSRSVTSDRYAAFDTSYEEINDGYRTPSHKELPNPHDYNSITPRSNGEIVVYGSDGKALLGVLQKPTGVAPFPAVVFCHGGFALGQLDQESVEPLIEKGFAVFCPSWRGENGNDGEFTLYYGESADAIAAMEHLRRRPDIIEDSIFLAGHSIGATVAMLASVRSDIPRGVAAVGGVMDIEAITRKMPLSQFIDSPIRLQKKDLRLRSPAAFLRDIDCPVRLYYGEEDAPEMIRQGEEIQSSAKKIGLPITCEVHEGLDHLSALSPSMSDAAEFFSALLKEPRKKPLPPVVENHFWSRIGSDLTHTRGIRWRTDQAKELSIEWPSIVPTKPTKLLAGTALGVRADLPFPSATSGDWTYMQTLNTVYFGNIRTKQVRAFTGVSPGHGLVLDISPDGKYFCWRGPNSPSGFSVYGTDDGRLVHKNDDAISCRFAKDGLLFWKMTPDKDSQKYATHFWNGYKIWKLNLTTRESEPVVEVHNGGCWAVSPDRRHLAISQPANKNAFVIPARGFEVFKADPAETELLAIDIETGKTVGKSRYQQTSSGHSLAFSPDGRHVATIAGDLITIWEFTTGKLIVGTGTPLVKLERKKGTIDWLGKEVLVLNKKEAISARTGAHLGTISKSFDTMTQDMQFALLPPDLASILGENHNLLNPRCVSLTFTGHVTTGDVTKDDDNLKRFLTEAVEIKLGVAAVEPGECPLTIEVAYTERAAPGKAQAKAYLANGVQCDSGGRIRRHLPAAEILSVTLSLTLKRNDTGDVLWQGMSDSGKQPRAFELSMPAKIQYQAASIKGAITSINTRDFPGIIPREKELAGKFPMRLSLEQAERIVDVVEPQKSTPWNP
jgi:dienelactone hydrolase